MLVTTNGVKYKIERDKFNKPDIYSTKDLVKAKIVVFA
jgi:hypothetical protein